MQFPVALAVSVVLVGLFVRAGRRLRLVDRPGDLKIHAVAIPITGGLGVVTAALLAVAVAGDVPPVGVVGGVVLALVVGLVDDIRPLSPLLRIALLSLAGAVIAAAGLGLDQLGPLAAVGTVLLMLACTNAVNLIDGQDGLAGGLALIAAVGLAGLAGASPSWVGLLALATAGALGGFLAWNRPPARIFLGNNGAYAVGGLLAVLIAGGVSDGEWNSMLGAFLVVGVFAFEFVATVLRRLLSGGTLTGGDRDHSYDLLSEISGSRVRVTLLYWLTGIAFAVLGVFASDLDLVVSVGLGVAVATLAGVAGIQIWKRSSERDHSAGDSREASPA